MTEIGYTPEDITYLEEKRRSAQLVVSHIFEQKAKQYLEKPVLTGIFSFRSKDGNEFIVANYDWFKYSLNYDFTDCLELEIEREAQQLLLARGRDVTDSFEPVKHEAIRRTLIKANQEGLLDRYMEFKRQTFKTIEASGDTHAMQELEYYIKTTTEIRPSVLI